MNSKAGGAAARFSTVLDEVKRGLVALQPYHDQLLLIGGIVPFLYRQMPALRVPEHPALATTEADLSVPARLPIIDGKPVLQLLKQAGFVVYESPGLSHKSLGKQFIQDARHGNERPAPTYLEFVAPLRGKPRESMAEPQAGLRVPLLRYLDLLTHEALTIDLKDVSSFELTTSCRVRVPHPTMFVLQKALIRENGRSPHKQPKDMAYVYDAAILTQPLWANLASVTARARAHSAEWKTWLDRAHRDLKVLFESPTSDGTVEAARVYRDAMTSGAPSERSIHNVVTRFLASL